MEQGIWSTQKDRKTDEEGKSTASTKSLKDVSRGVMFRRILLVTEFSEGRKVGS